MLVTFRSLSAKWRVFTKTLREEAKLAAFFDDCDGNQ